MTNISRSVTDLLNEEQIIEKRRREREYMAKYRANKKAEALAKSQDNLQEKEDLN